MVTPFGASSILRRVRASDASSAIAPASLASFPRRTHRGGLESRTTVSSTNVLVPSAFVTSTRRYRSPASITILSSPRAECSRHSGPTRLTSTTPSWSICGLRSLSPSVRRRGGLGGTAELRLVGMAPRAAFAVFFVAAGVFMNSRGGCSSRTSSVPKPEPGLEPVEWPERRELDAPVAEVLQVPPRRACLVDERVTCDSAASRRSVRATR